MKILKKIKYIILFSSWLFYSVSTAIAGVNLERVNSLLDSVKTEILSQGLNHQNLDSYNYYLINGASDVEEELQFVRSLPSSTSQKILLGILFKKKNDFEKEYETLKVLIDSLPVNPQYYEELVLSAKISGKLNELENLLTGVKDEQNYLKFANALIEYYKGNYSAAAEKLKRLIDDNFNPFEVFYLYSYSLRNLGNYPEALLQLKTARNVLRDKKNLPEILNAEGSLYYLSGNYDKARQLYERAKNISEITFNTSELIKSYINLAILSDENGELNTARKLFSEALSLAKRINNPALQALVHSELGVSFTYDNRLVKAEKHYNQSLKFYGKLNDRNRLAILHANLGKIYSAMSNYKFAIETFEEGLILSGENKRSQIMNLTGIADVYANLSNYAKALSYYNRAKKLASEIKELSVQAEIEEGLGILELNLELPRKALRYFEKAEKLSENLNNSFFKADLLHKFGVAYFALGENRKAETSLLEANRINKANGDIYNTLLVNLDLAGLFIRQKKLDKARKLLSNAKKICDDYNLDNLLIKQYLLSAQLNMISGNTEFAEQLLQKAVRLSEKTRNHNFLIESKYMLGKLYGSVKNYDDAIRMLVEAKNNLESTGRPLFEKQEIQISYFSGFNKIYEDLAKLYLELGNDIAAFEVIDAQRSRNTYQNLNNLKITSVINDKALLKKLYELDWIIASGIYSGAELDSIKNDYDELKSEIINKNPVLKNYLGFNKNKSLHEIQNGLETDERFVLYFTTGNYTQVFILSKDNFYSVRIPVTRDSIVNLIKNISPFYKNEVGGKEIFFNQDLFSFNAETSYKLYKIFIKPILSKLKPAEKIIFSPSVPMLQIPMEFLVTNYRKNESPYNYNNLKFLIDYFAVSYAQSGNTFIALQEEHNRETETNLLIGNPVIKNANFVYSIRGSLLEDTETLRDINLESLEFSEMEIEEINNYLGNAEIFLSDKATESNFKKYAPLSKIIHLSTHSFLYKNQPLIVFSEGGKESNDGLLEKGEIIQLNLNADMVVLSSCKSGLGVVDKSEGILGMQKSFIDAGANSVVVSLWDVNDKSTAVLMKYFYKYLREGFDKSTSLQLAKKEFIKNESANPYYWAAFILTGNPSKIKFRNQAVFPKYLFLILSLAVAVFVLYSFIRKKIVLSKS